MSVHQPIRKAPRLVRFDLNKIDPTDALYLIDLVSEALDDPDPITNACQSVAFQIAGDVPEVPFGPDTHEAADAIYPQAGGELTWREFHKQRDEHLRRFGMLDDFDEALPTASGSTVPGYVA